MGKRNKNYNKYINEVTIKLLPEKEKRDYILRMVSFIIVMIFIIINFFLIFLPRLELQNKVDSVKRNNYSLESSYYNLLEQYYDVDITVDGKKLFDVSKNNDAVKLEYNQVDVFEVTEDLLEQLEGYPFSYIENVRYTSSNNTLVVNMQFILPEYLNEYHQKIEAIPYLTSVQLVSQSAVKTNEGLDRQKANFVLTLNPESEDFPKVGGQK
jgi:hypothetical protein